MRRTTRSPGCSGCPIPAGRTSTGRPPATQPQFAFPRGLTAPKDLAKHRFDFSFSGLKTSVARWVETRERDGEPVPIADVAASFQEAVCDVLSAKAIDACRATGAQSLLIGGGVAANQRLRALLAERATAAGIALRTPRPGLCTDNGAMIAVLGAEVIAADGPPSSLDIGADPSLPVSRILV